MRGLLTGDWAEGEALLEEVVVDDVVLEGVATRLFGGGVGRMPLLPQELRRAQEGPWALLPPHDVAPLVQQQGQVTVATDPLAKGRPDDRLGGRPNDEGFLKGFATTVGNDRQLGREPLDVFRLLHDETHRDEEGEVGVLDAMALEARVEVALNLFPDEVAIRAQDVAPAHRCLVDKFRLSDDVLVPLGKIGRARHNRPTGSRAFLPDLFGVVKHGRSIPAPSGETGGQARATRGTLGVTWHFRLWIPGMQPA